MARISADVGQLASLKTTFDRQSQNVQELTRAIGGEVESAWWIGGAADRFKDQWRNDFAPMLQRLQQALQEAGAEVDRRRQAIEQAGG